MAPLSCQLRSKREHHALVVSVPAMSSRKHHTPRSREASRTPNWRNVMGSYLFILVFEKTDAVHWTREPTALTEREPGGVLPCRGKALGFCGLRPCAQQALGSKAVVMLGSRTEPSTRPVALIHSCRTQLHTQVQLQLRTRAGFALCAAEPGQRRAHAGLCPEGVLPPPSAWRSDVGDLVSQAVIDDGATVGSAIFDSCRAQECQILEPEGLDLLRFRARQGLAWTRWPSIM